MSLESTLFLIFILASLSAIFIILNPINPDMPCEYVYPEQNTPESPQNVTEPQTKFNEVDSITKTFDATGEAVIERYIYNQTADICWMFTREFRKYNPEWSELTLGTGQSFGTYPHSVSYLRRNNNSAYIHDAWGGDTFILEFDEAGNFTMWDRIENNTKIFDTRNSKWLSQYDHFHFNPNERQTIVRTLTQDNRQAFIKGEI